MKNNLLPPLYLDCQVCLSVSLASRLVAQGVPSTRSPQTDGTLGTRAPAHGRLHGGCACSLDYLRGQTWPHRSLSQCLTVSFLRCPLFGVKHVSAAFRQGAGHGEHQPAICAIRRRGRLGAVGGSGARRPEGRCWAFSLTRRQERSPQHTPGLRRGKLAGVLAHGGSKWARILLRRAHQILRRRQRWPLCSPRTCGSE